MPSTAHRPANADTEPQASMLGEEDPGAAYDCLLATVPGFRESMATTRLQTVWRTVWPGLAVAIGGLLLMRCVDGSRRRR